MCVLKALPTALLNVANGAGVAVNQVPLGGGFQGCLRRMRPELYFFSYESLQ